MKNRTRFARMLRDARGEKGLSYRRLADLAQLSFGFLADLEKGKRNPTPDVVGRIAAALQIDPAPFIAAMNREKIERLQEQIEEIREAS